jgi:CRISPR/Cas system CSM-associated protein Csm3 (group 7 of RAMP superfamily)
MGQRRPFVPEFPKPFDFVPFTDQVERRARPGHDSFQVDRYLSGRLLYEIEVQTLLHVSSGNYALTEDLGLPARNVVRDLYKVRVKGQELPAIPGSTLKGATRAVVEAVTASCLGVTRVDRRDLPGKVSRSCSPPDLCPACGLYGAMSRLGRLSFSDALFVRGDATIARMPALFRPRPGQGHAYRDQAGRFIGRKFYFHGLPQAHKEGHYVEVMKPGTVLQGNVEFSRLAEPELGLLFFALGLDGSFQLMLGGGKPVAMGRVAFTPIELRLRQTASFTEYETGDGVLAGKPLAQAIADYIRQAEDLILAAQRDSLRQILDPANQRVAPTGVY